MFCFVLIHAQFRVIKSYKIHGILTRSVRIAEVYTEHIIASTQNRPNYAVSAQR